MIDIHSHILFGVDDGPSKLEESISILEKASNEGITDIISTSHAFHPQFHVSKETVLQQIKAITYELEVRKIPINIHSGQEIRLKDFVGNKLESGEALSLANSKYVLLELPSQGIPAYTVHIIGELLNQNRIPIIAHPERNKAIAEKPSRLLRLINHGALSQVTAGSLAGHFGKSIQRTSLQLVEANLIHTYGSDVHNLSNRPLLFNEGINYLEKQKQIEMIDILLENNERILRNEDLILLEPEEISNKKWWKIFA